MSESQHRRGDAQDRTGVRQTRPSGTRQARPSGANGTRRPSSSGNPKKRRKRRKKRSVNSRIGKVLLIVAIVIAFAVAGAILGTVFGILQSTDMLNTSDVLPDSYTSVIYDADDNEVDKLHGEENREYVKLSAITSNMQNAVIAIEDQRFYEHNGIDIRGIMRAMAENIKTMSFSQGASTLTQQVLKNEVLESEKSISRKIKEQYLAISLENALKKQLGSKDAAKKYILELYLNTIPLHHGLRGVEAASQYYFGKHASELTLAEAASIAGITKTPSLYAPDMNQEASKERQMTVLKKMLDLNMITQAEYDEAAAEDIYAHLVCKDTAEEESNAKHNWFVEAAVQQIKADLMEKKNMTAAQASNMIYSGGLQIHTTMDASMQETAEAAMKNDNMFPAGDGKMDVTYLISVLDTQNPDESSNQSHYEKKTTVTSQEEADAFVALTGMDEENIVVALYAKAKKVSKVIAKINRISFDEILDALDIDGFISPKMIAANNIVRYVRAMQNSAGSSNVETLHKLVNEQIEALEFKVREKSSVVGVPLKDLKTKSEVLVATIIRNGRVIIPGGNDMIEVDDSVIIITRNKHLTDLKDILK